MGYERCYGGEIEVKRGQAESVQARLMTNLRGEAWRLEEKGRELTSVKSWPAVLPKSEMIFGEC